MFLEHSWNFFKLLLLVFLESMVAIVHQWFKGIWPFLSFFDTLTQMLQTSWFVFLAFGFFACMYCTYS